MANEKHLLLRLEGDYDDSALTAEIWQTQLRLALVFGEVDDIGTLPSNWNPQATTIARTETDWTINGNWFIDGPDPQSFDPGDFLNDQVAPALIDWIPNMHLWQKVRLRRASLLPCGSPNGKGVPAPPYAVATPCVLEWTGNYPVGVGSTAPLPLQASMVLSHSTPQVGSAGRGRMFMPAATSGDTSATRWSSTAINDCMADHVTFLQALTWAGAGSSIAPHVRPIVTGGNFVNYGAITRVRIGNQIDTQRRRRNRLVETYTEAPV